MFEELEGFADEVAQIAALALVVLDLVTDVRVAVAEDVEDRQDLAVVGDECFADHVAGEH